MELILYNFSFSPPLSLPPPPPLPFLLLLSPPPSPLLPPPIFLSKIIVGVHNDESYFALKNKVPIDNTEKRMSNVKKYAHQVYCTEVCTMIKERGLSIRSLIYSNIYAGKPAFRGFYLLVRYMPYCINFATIPTIVLYDNVKHQAFIIKLLLPYLENNYDKTQYCLQVALVGLIPRPPLTAFFAFVVNFSTATKKKLQRIPPYEANLSTIFDFFMHIGSSKLKCVSCSVPLFHRFRSPSPP